MNTLRQLVELDPYGWAIFPREDDAVEIEYYGEGYYGDLEQGAGHWMVEAETLELAIQKAIKRYKEDAS